jgi:hypothetical protein
LPTSVIIGIKEGIMPQAQAEKFIPTARDVASVLRDYGLPDGLARGIWRSLAYFMETDGDPIPPDFGSLQLLLTFLSNHRDLPSPALGISHQGVIDAVWDSPGVFRWAISFHPVGGAEWTVLERRDGVILRRSGRSGIEEIEIPERINPPRDMAVA